MLTIVTLVLPAAAVTLGARLHRLGEGGDGKRAFELDEAAVGGLVEILGRRFACVDAGAMRRVQAPSGACAKLRPSI